MICPSCQTANPDGTKFCFECGSALAQQCPSCGASVVPGHKFCGECGSPVSAVAPVVANPMPEPAPTGPASAEMRLVSVLFVDLVGFTSLSEGREAEDVRELLGRYFDSARTIVERYGGTIEKFIGDAVMAVWGVPTAREDDAERAVRAALDVVDSVTVFGSEVGAPDLRARAGVVTGQVAALENPGEGLVVGDRVNTASRVQSAAAPGSVFVDEVTRGVTSASIVYEDAGEHEVKGKAEPLRLWRAVRVVAGVRGAQREQGIEAPFVGRDGDLRLLKELFHGALERRSARLVAVTGEAGVGKSRLLREFTNYTDGIAEQVLWHSGHCPSYGEGVAYWALAEMVRQRLGIPEEATPEEAREKLDAGLARWLPEPADRDFVTPRLGALIGVAEPGLGREELFAGWRMFFERLAAHMPVVLVFEDLQWADQGLLDFISQLLDWSASSRIFVLGLARPELAARHQGWPAGVRAATLLPLEPLEPDAMRALLAGVVEGLSRSAADQIVDRAEGVPLYAVETLRALADRGVLLERDGGLALVGELGELDVPASLGSLLAARIDALEPDERQLVKALSVFGGSFPRASAAALGGVDEDELDGVLAGLVRKQVLAIRSDPLSPDRGQFTFSQGLFRTVAYEMLSRQERKARHLAAAEHLREAFPSEGEEVAEAIATHLLDAYHAGHDDPDAAEIRVRAVAALRRAAQRAATVGAPETAERVYLTARDLAEDEAEQIELVQAAGEVAIQSGRPDVAVELFEQAVALHSGAGRDVDAARLTGRIALCLRRLGRNDEAVARVRQALQVLGEDALDPGVAERNIVLGAAMVWAGHHDAAEPPLERGLRIAEHLQLLPLLVGGFSVKATLRMLTDRILEARALFLGTVELAEQHGAADRLSTAYGNLGALSWNWDMPGAKPYLEKALGITRRRGDRYLGSINACNLSMILLQEGLWEEIDQRIPEFLDEGDEDRPGDAFLHQVQALLRAHRGERQAAAASLARLDPWHDSEDADLRATRAAVAVVVHLAAGDAEQALSLGLEGMPGAVQVVGGAGDSVRIAWGDSVRAAVQLGRLDDARTLIGLIGDLPPGRVPPYMRAQLALARGLLGAAEARAEEAETQFAAAVGGFRELGYQYALALAQTDLAAWLIEQGRRGEAEALLEEAEVALRSLGAGPALARAEALRLSPAPADAVTP